MYIAESKGQGKGGAGRESKKEGAGARGLLAGQSKQWGHEQPPEEGAALLGGQSKEGDHWDAKFCMLEP